ncbi:MAG: transglutaminase domain-containing protein [Candidatus Cloacimonetes bacterium]|nr:transglutaminase domain-containing protein [Candidatus Cloacimonadota bacterium]MBS3766989.1 transglutaminase domain-containing protein [Candidatus Cloacimonadota bacterium]
MQIRNKFIAIILISIILTACSVLQKYDTQELIQNSPQKYRADIEKTLQAAGDNKNELLQVLAHYQNDPKKLEAASFLIANMKNHKYVEVGIFDSLDNQIKYNVLDYDNYHQIKDFLDSVEVERGELKWDKVLEEKDAETISADLLIDNIDLAFQAYNTLAWTQNLGWQTFLEFILPYRGSSEPLSDWRTYFWEKFASMRDTISDPLTLANKINQKCREMFKFKDVYYMHPTDQGLPEMLETGAGRCEDMTNFTIYAMRANGLAVTSDYTPHWPNRSNNHAWNALILGEDKAIPFMGAEADPGEYSLGKPVAKVYRKLFFKAENTLAEKLSENEKAPAWLSGNNFRDVTPAYTETADIDIEYLKPQNRFAYLAIFNSNQWKAIDWAVIDSSGNASFQDMGTAINYLPMYYRESDSLTDDEGKPKWELIPASNPILLSKVKKIHIFSNDSLKLRDRCKNDFVLNKIPGGLEIEAEKQFQLLIWANDDWQTIVDTTTQTDSLLLEKYYKNSLYKLQRDPEDDEKIKLFTIKEDSLITW